MIGQGKSITHVFIRALTVPESPKPLALRLFCRGADARLKRREQCCYCFCAVIGFDFLNQASKSQRAVRFVSL